jgi:hypothetical protein
MLSEKESICYFLLGCIPTRIVISVLPLYIPLHWLHIYSVLLIIIALSFLFLYFSNMRQHAFEAGGNTWWASYRIIHGILYLIAGTYAFNKNRSAWIPLTIDTVLGLILFLNKRLI